jgi:BirA family biotin operon repressor/biotin-[acetyl-CoA-carboxylase] ligase
MNASLIAAQLSAPVTVEVVDQTGSTNLDLLARAATLQGPHMLAAIAQTAGRGRAGRSWLSAPGKSLTFSLAWPFAGGVAQLAGLPLAVGVAHAETLKALGVPAQLKWPNDVLRDGAKLAGILVETTARPQAGVWAVIGIGLNLEMPDALEQQIGRDVASAAWLAQMDRNTLAATLLEALAAALDRFGREGFTPFCARWNLLHAWQGELVAIVDQGKVLQEGLAAGVDERGQLLLDSADGRAVVVAGDVSLRRREPAC